MVRSPSTSSKSASLASEEAQEQPPSPVHKNASLTSEQAEEQPPPPVHTQEPERQEPMLHAAPASTASNENSKEAAATPPQPLRPSTGQLPRKGGQGKGLGTKPPAPAAPLIAVQKEPGTEKEPQDLQNTPKSRTAKRSLEKPGRIPEGYEDAPTPPAKLSTGAIDRRLRRIVTPKSNGDFKVPDEIVRQFKGDKEERDKLFAAFEKVGYRPDSCALGVGGGGGRTGGWKWFEGSNTGKFQKHPRRNSTGPGNAGCWCVCVCASISLSLSTLEP